MAAIREIPTINMLSSYLFNLYRSSVYACVWRKSFCRGLLFVCTVVAFASSCSESNVSVEGELDDVAYKVSKRMDELAKPQKAYIEHETKKIELSKVSGTTLTEAQGYLNDVPGGYLARIEMNNPTEVKEALSRALKVYEDGGLDKDDPPLALVLHGPEVSIFLEENYSEHKEIVDLARKLTDLNVVNVRVCEVRTNTFDRGLQSLAPFVGTVPFGPSEVKRLIEEEDYVYF